MKEITDEPLIWRYFVTPLPTKLLVSQLDEREFIVKYIFRINTTVSGAYVFSSGKKYGCIQSSRISRGCRPVL